MAEPSTRATTIREAQWACELVPLPSGDDRWVDLKQIRGTDVQERFKRLLIKPEIAKDTFSHITFAGHRGCGKSTELYQLSETLKDGKFLVIYCQANEELDLSDIDFSDLLLAGCKVLVEELGSRFELNKDLLQQLTDWFSEITKVDTETVKKEIEIQTEAKAEAKIPFLASFLAKVTALLKGTKESREEIRRQILKSPDQLIFRVNQLLDDCYRAVRETGAYDEILLVFDNLDRYSPETVHQVLIEQADNLKRLRCNVIYTVPISLIYEPKREALPDVFKNVVLPMIKIRERNQSWEQTFPSGIQKLTEVIERRIEVAKVFSKQDLVTTLALKSGGSLRELMRLVQEACIEAIEDKIDQAAVDKAVTNVRSEFIRPMPQSYLVELAKIHTTKNTDNTPEHRSILFYRYALEYNGNRWVDVHPLIYDLAEFQAALKSLSGGKTPKTSKKR